MRKPRAKKPLYLYPANIMFKALSRMGVSLGAINVLTVAGRVSGPVMTAFPAAVPHGVRLFKALGLVNGADPDQFAAAADHVTAFEVLPSPAPSRTPYSSAPS